MCLLVSVNQALLKPTSQSSVSAAGNLAVDGNPTPASGTCSMTTPEAYPWWQVDLGSVKRVATVVVVSR